MPECALGSEEAAKAASLGTEVRQTGPDVGLKGENLEV